MAQVKRVTTTCDGFCGGTEVDGEGESVSIKPIGMVNRGVDLCIECAAKIREVYNRGALVKAGRPRTRKEVVASAPSLRPTIVAQSSPVTGPVEVVPTVPVAEPVGEPVAEPVAESSPAFSDEPLPADVERDADGWPVEKREVPLGTGI